MCIKSQTQQRMRQKKLGIGLKTAFHLLQGERGGGMISAIFRTFLNFSQSSKALRDAMQLLRQIFFWFWELADSKNDTFKLSPLIVYVSMTIFWQFSTMLAFFQGLQHQAFWWKCKFQNKDFCPPPHADFYLSLVQDSTPICPWVLGPFRSA